MTEHWTDQGRLHLCAIEDVHSNRTVGCSIDSWTKASPAVGALRAALAQVTGRRGGPRRRGSRFRSRASVRELRAAGPAGPMGRVGACAENAAMESRFALLHENALDRRRRITRQDLRSAIVTWIERTHHRRRRRRRLDGSTPVGPRTVYGLTGRLTHPPREPARAGAVAPAAPGGQ